MSGFDTPVDMPSPQESHYNDFNTIDWQRDMTRDRMRHRFLMKRKYESIWKYIYSVFDAWSGWLCVFLLGVTAGVTAAVMDIGVNWMSNIREGVCPGAFWLNKEQCCWASPQVKYNYDTCSEWTEWSRMFNLKSDGVHYYGVQYMMYIIISAVLAVLCALLVRSFAPYAVGSGITEIKTILSGFIMRGFLGKWTYVIKSTCVMLAVSSGLSVGQEGPMIHIACCVGNIMTGLFPKYGKNEAKKREILSAAAAAGVSIAFGAPIGGVLFSLEEISYYFPMKTLWRSFFCALVAAFTVRSINPFGNDHSVLFYVDYDTPWVYGELVAFFILGALGGVLGAVFIKLNIKWCRFRKSSVLGKYPITEVLGVCILTAILTYPNEFTRMNAGEMISMMFSDCGPADNAMLCAYARNYTSLNPSVYVFSGLQVTNSAWLLLAAFCAKLVLTLLAFGVKVPAGLIIPSLAIGGLLGRLCGIVMEQIVFEWPHVLFMQECSRRCVTPGLYAVVGAAAVLGGISRMTISLVVIMFEITGGINTIIPVMLAAMASKWVGDAICKESVYEAHIKLNNYPFLYNDDELRHSSVASDIMQPRIGTPRTLPLEGLTLQDLKNILKETEYSGFPVVSNDAHALVGFIWKTDLELAIVNAEKGNLNLRSDASVDLSFPSCSAGTTEELINFGTIVDLAPITINVSTQLEMIIEMFAKLGLRQVLVTRKSVLVGIITKKDILNHLQYLSREP